MGIRGKNAGLWFVSTLLTVLFVFCAHKAHATTLEQILVSVYENNPQLNSQRARVRAVDEGVPQAMAGYRPKVNATLSSGLRHEEQTIGPIAGKTFSSHGDSKPRSAEITG